MGDAAVCSWCTAGGAVSGGWEFRWIRERRCPRFRAGLWGLGPVPLSLFGLTEGDAPCFETF